MASKKRQREIERAEREREKAASRSRRWIAFSIIAALATMFAIFLKRQDSASHLTQARAALPEKWTLDTLLKLAPHQIEALDIALLNLLCAEGLPGSESLDLDRSLTALDEMARRVMLETDRHFYRFTNNPAEFNHPEADFRMMMMATVLQQDFGIRYNPERISTPDKLEATDKFYANSKDVFIHGCTGAYRTGTCASLPVFYTAIARRLKYPLHIASTKGHLFARWDDGNERLNLEATAAGFAPHPDSKYRNWPHGISDAEMLESKFLQNMSATEEFATFLSTRSFVLFAAKRYRECMEAADAAIRFAPNIAAYEKMKRFLAHEIEKTNTLRVRVPLDPIFQMAGGDEEWAARRAELMSEANRLTEVPAGVPNPDAEMERRINPLGRYQISAPHIPQSQPEYQEFSLPPVRTPATKRR